MLKIFKPFNREPFTMAEIEKYMSLTEAYELEISKFFRVEEAGVTTTDETIGAAAASTE